MGLPAREVCGRMWRVKRIVAIIVGVACLCGCSLSKRIARATAKVEKMYAEARVWHELPEKTITWQQALLMMQRENLDLQELDDSVKKAERESLSVYTDMIPGVSYGGYMSRTLAELTRPLDSEELRQHVNVTFYMPEISRVPYKVYASKARTYAAMKSREFRERELMSQLYKLVRTHELEAAKLALMEKATEEKDKQELEQQRLQKRQNDERYWREMAQLLGRRDARWNILPASMPRVRWEEYNTHLDRLGEPVVCELVLALENARMAQYGVAMSYLPTLNTSLYSPSLFVSSGGVYGGTFLGGHDTHVSLNLNYSLDTKLQNWNQYQDSKARYEREKVRVADRLVEHKNMIQRLRESMREYCSWRSYMQKHMAYLQNSTPQNADEYIERERTIYNMQKELLNQESTAIEAEAAVLLEYGTPDQLRKS